MKNVMYKMMLFIYALILMSCQNELSENLENITSNEIKTKSVVSGMPPTWQLVDIAVNIKPVKHQVCHYLSSRTDNNVVNLHEVDDESLRQRWLLFQRYEGTMNIKVKGNAYRSGYMFTAGNVGSYVPRLLNEGETQVPWGYGFQQIPNTSYYYITTYGGTIGSTVYLCAENNSSRNLKFMGKSQADVSGIWEVIPIEEFELIDVKYSKEVNDKAFRSVNLLRTYRFLNDKNPSSISHDFNVSEQLTQTSQFSTVEGLNMTNKISNHGSFKVGLPIINIDGGINTEQTTTKTWTYTTTELTSKVSTISDKISTVIPPYSIMNLSVYSITYDCNLTYIATLKGKVSNKTIKLIGKWSGVEGTELTYEPVVVKANGAMTIMRIEGRSNKSDFDKLRD